MWCCWTDTTTATAAKTNSRRGPKCNEPLRSRQGLGPDISTAVALYRHVRVLPMPETRRLVLVRRVADRPKTAPKEGLVIRRHHPSRPKSACKKAKRRPEPLHLACPQQIGGVGVTVWAAHIGGCLPVLCCPPETWRCETGLCPGARYSHRLGNVEKYDICVREECRSRAIPRSSVRMLTR